MGTLVKILKNRLRDFCCFIGWHSSYDILPLEYGGVDPHACCKHCGHKGIINSYGYLL